MKIERLSDNQIKCTLSSHDLESRHVNLRELAYGTEKARQLFSDMLEEAGELVGFHADNSPLMIEAVPMGGDGLVCFITKVDNPDELDTRFARFAPSIMSQLSSSIPDSTAPARSSAEEVLRAFGRFIDLATREITQNKEETAEPGDLYRAFFFDDMKEAKAAASIVRRFFDQASSLYERPEGGLYLVLHKGSCDAEIFNKLCNVMTEYGAQVRTNCMSEAYYREHYTTVYDGDAVGRLCRKR